MEHIDYSALDRGYKVLVRCFTYNQAQYVEDALHSFVMQQTDFPFICLVVDDCSTDGEQDVLRAFVERECVAASITYAENEHTHLVHAQHKDNPNCYFAMALLKKNLYKQKDLKLEVIVKPWRGMCQYEALCEGDDCWNNNRKLQMQSAYLDSHADCVLVHTDYDIENVQTREVERAHWRHSNNFNQINRDWGKDTAALMLQGKYTCMTLTCMMRLESVFAVEQELKSIAQQEQLLMRDTQMWMLHSRRGTIHYIPEVTSTYHVVAESATHSKNYSNVIRFYSSCIDMVNLYSEYLDIHEAGEQAKQTYIYFLLKEIYMNDIEFLKEIREKVVRGVRLDWKNSMLAATINAPKAVKKTLLILAKACDRIGTSLDYQKAKFFGL